MPTNFVRPPARSSAAINPMTGGSGSSGYRSQCKICGDSIHGEPAIWSRDPLAPGLVHTDCAKKKESA